MKNLLIILTFFYPISTLAIFSAFEVVKPGTKHEKTLGIKVLHSKNLENCTIEFFPYGYDHKHAWLVVSSRPLTNKEQELREYVWGQSAKPSSIELFVKLSPMKHEQVNEENAKDSRYIVTLSSELASRSYVYFDFPQVVFDGGYYYSVPLDNYCGYRK